MKLTPWMKKYLKNKALSRLTKRFKDNFSWKAEKIKFPIGGSLDRRKMKSLYAEVIKKIEK